MKLMKVSEILLVLTQMHYIEFKKYNKRKNIFVYTFNTER